MLFGALLLRVVLAFILFPHSGFKVDIGDFDSWAGTLETYGPGGFYTHAGFSDYTPGYLYILWLYRGATHFIGGFTGDVPLFDAGELKVPAILFDLALGYLIYRTLRSWKGERAGLIGAALYLFNPVTWYESALWGQVDSVGALVLLAAVLLLVAGWSEAAAGTAMLATLVKPQYGIVLFVVGFVLLGRHLLQPGSGPRPVPRHPLAVRLNEALGGWFTAEQGPWRLVSSGAVALLVLFAVITPFDLAEFAAKTVPNLPIGGDLGGLLVVVGQAVGQYHYLTVNAFNPWALVGPTPLAWTGLWTNDLTPAIGAIPYYAVGAALLTVTLTFLGYQLLRRSDRTSLIVTATVVAVAVFIVPTRVHERYVFPAFALGALLAGPSSRWRWWYVALALANVANLHANLTNPLYGTSNVIGLPFGELFRSGNFVALIATAQTLLFAWALWHVRPALDDVLNLFRVRTRPVEPEEPDRPEEHVPVRGAAASVAVPLAGPPAMVWRTPWTPLPDLSVVNEQLAWTDEPRVPDEVLEPDEALASNESPAAEEALAAPGAPWDDFRLEPPRWLAALRWRLRLPALRPDRSRQLHAEGPGRIDRLDLVAHVLILVFGLALRAFRADQPFQMVTLDEIYHARTATERTGVPRSLVAVTRSSPRATIPAAIRYLASWGWVYS
jgi:Gpi18-like mannosyltransferase